MSKFSPLNQFGRCQIKNFADRTGTSAVSFPAENTRQATERDRIVGERIKALRKFRKLTQTALGEAVGVTYQKVQKYEDGTNCISAEKLRMIAKFFQVPDFIFFDDGGASQEKDVSLPAARPKQSTEADRVVGERVKALRKFRKLSQAALGEAIGVTFQQIRKYEVGQNRIGAGRLKVIAEFLQVPVSILFDDIDDSQGKLEAFEFLNILGAVDLLREFVAIEHDETRGKILSIVITVASIRLD